MNYIDFLVRAYTIVQKAHQLGKMLDAFTCEQGEVLVPKGFVEAVDEFNDAFTKYAKTVEEGNQDASVTENSKN